MSITYYVALPFVHDEEGNFSIGRPQECQNETSAVRWAESLARKPEYVGAVAFKRSGEPNQGNFGDAVVLKRFGDTPDRLEEF
jgi:hypothetical protein